MPPTTDANPLSRLDMLAQELGRQMSLISEEASCSSWAWGIEEELPPLLTTAAASGKPATYQCVEISPIYAQWLVSLAAELGHWVTQGDGVAYVPYQPESAVSLGDHASSDRKL